MVVDDDFRKRLGLIFGRLNTAAATHSFPAPRTLSLTLEPLVPAGRSGQQNIDATAAMHFATGAVDIWLRGVHSFLVSTALTASSPIWASAVGYYSSHYAVRGLAHLLGCFQLFGKKRIVHLTLQGGTFVASFQSKDGGDREHKIYWNVVKRSAAFQSDGLFAAYAPATEESDVRHRNHANYADHLMRYPAFKPLDEQAIKDRIEYISKIQFDTPPIPRFSKFPDVENVQLIAYHRLVAFRSLLDEALGAKNRFWNVHRTPAFAMEFMDFQLVRSGGLLAPT